MTAAADWRRVEKFPGHPDHDEYVLGARVDYRGLVAIIRPSESLGVRTWSLTLDGCGSATIQWIETLEKAQEVGAYLYAALLPDVLAKDGAQDALLAAERERHESERPAREAAARKQAAAVAAAPVVDALKCPECAELFREGEEGEAVYECSRCSGRSLERRCADCNIFAAKVAEESCPHCEAALEEAPAHVQAADLDGHLHEKGQP